MTETVISTQQLTRHFGAFVAVDAVTFAIPQGAIYGLLGPNGSGKSTIIRMLCGVLQPTAGSCHILGFDSTRQAESIKPRIGYMSQKFSLYHDLTVRENLEFSGRIYGLRGRRLSEQTAAMLALTGLNDRITQLTRTLSGGWKQRLALACALIHAPDVLFLDEPTAGIDPVARRELWDLPFRLSAQGKTLLVTTHYMDEAERCSYVGYIDHGRLLISGQPHELKQLPEVQPTGTRRVEVLCDQPMLQRRRLQQTPGIREATLFGDTIHLLVENHLNDTTVLMSLQPQATPPTVREISPSLEDVFVTLSQAAARRSPARPIMTSPMATAVVQDPVLATSPRKATVRRQPLNGLLAILFKEVRHICRDVMTLIFMLVIPLIQITLFGYALDPQVRHIPTVVYNLDGRPDSERLIESFANARTFQITQRVFDDTAFQRTLTSGTAKVGIRIPPNYTEKLLHREMAQVAVVIDGGDAQVGTSALTHARLLGMNSALTHARSFNESLQVAPARDQGGHFAPAIDIRPRLLYNPDLRSEWFFVPGLVGVILQLVTLFLTTFAIIREREFGTLEQLFVTPVGRIGLLFGKLIPYGVIGLIEIVLVLNVMVFLFQVPIQGSLALLFALSVVFLVSGLGLGLLLSTIAKTQAQAIQLAFLITLPSVLLSGFIFPRNNMPAPIYALSHVFPVTYFIEILRGIILRRADASDLSLWITGLSLSAVVILSLSIWRFQKSLD